MPDEVQRYLRQQMELGGAEVVLSRPLQAGPGAPEQIVAATAAAAPAPSGGEMALSRDAAPGGGKWRKGAPPIPGPGLSIDPPPMEALDELGRMSLDEVAERIRTTSCCQTLCPKRTNAVPGDGNPRARLVLVGEAPGATEDAQGKPFVGAAGRLLDSILEAIDVPRKEVYITNIVKCRPPQNRKPLPDEVASCIPYLWRQLAIIKPAVIIALGSTSAESLLGVKKSLGELRNKVHSYAGIPLIVTYHPAALLRNPNWKKSTWDDVRIARQLLDR